MDPNGLHGHPGAASCPSTYPSFSRQTDRMQGSLRQRGQRSWELRVHNGRDALTGRTTYVQKTVRGSKREAEPELARFVTEVGDGAHSSTKSTTVGELLEQWFDHNEADWSPTVVNGTPEPPSNPGRFTTA